MAPAHRPRITVVMAIYHPDMARLARQVETIRAQNGVDVDLALFADGPMPQADAIAQLAVKTDRTAFELFETNRGPAETFISATGRALDQYPDSEFIAFADQDDLWAPDKLSRSVEALAEAAGDAVHTDARLVDGEGTEIAPSMFAYEGRDVSPSLARLFFRNNATGMTMVVTRALAERMVALRDYRPRSWLHDHFAAFLASAGKGLAFAPLTTVDYVQHGGNVVGARASGPGVGTSGNFLKSGSRTDMTLQQGSKLVEILATSDWPTSQGHAQLTRLGALLEGRGVTDLLRNARELEALTRNARPLLARLAWCKLTSHRWQ